jgi:NADH-quinone oxidoreductase subunit J
MGDAILFYAFGALIVIGALFVVTSKNIFHCALYLALTLFAVAAEYVLLQAYFLAAIQILIYIGAVVVLAIFVINLTKEITGRDVKLDRRRVIPAVLVSSLTACLIILVLLKAGVPAAVPQPLAADPTAVLGRHLLGDFVLPFEMVSVLLLSGLIAAIVIVSKDQEEKG